MVLFLGVASHAVWLPRSRGRAVATGRSCRFPSAESATQRGQSCFWQWIKPCGKPTGPLAKQRRYHRQEAQENPGHIRRRKGINFKKLWQRVFSAIDSDRAASRSCSQLEAERSLIEIEVALPDFGICLASSFAG